MSFFSFFRSFFAILIIVQSFDTLNHLSFRWSEENRDEQKKMQNWYLNAFNCFPNPFQSFAWLFVRCTNLYTCSMIVSHTLFRHLDVDTAYESYTGIQYTGWYVRINSVFVTFFSSFFICVPTVSAASSSSFFSMFALHSIFSLILVFIAFIGCARYQMWLNLIRELFCFDSIWLIHSSFSHIVILVPFRFVPSSLSVSLPTPSFPSGIVWQCDKIIDTLQHSILSFIRSSHRHSHSHSHLHSSTHPFNSYSYNRLRHRVLFIKQLKNCFSV